MPKKIILTYCTLIIAFGSYCQSDFDSVWTNPKYDSLVRLADSAFKKSDFISSQIFFSNAFELRPTTYSIRLKIISDYLNTQIVDSTLSDSVNKYNSIIHVADSLFAISNECDALRLYFIAKNLSNEKHPDEMLKKIHHPIHCDEIDDLYYKIVMVADKQYFNGNLEKAKLLYERALLLNKFEAYPKNQLNLIDN